MAGNLSKGYSCDAKSALAIAVDAAGNIDISQNSNHHIRMVTESTGNITTVTGTGSCGYNGDGGPATLAKISSRRGLAVDASGNIHIADSAIAFFGSIELVSSLLSPVLDRWAIVETEYSQQMLYCPILVVSLWTHLGVSTSSI